MRACGFRPVATFNRAEGRDSRAWDLVFLDEGHKIKNHNTQQYKALRELQGRMRVIITGTPVQVREGCIRCLSTRLHGACFDVFPRRLQRCQHEAATRASQQRVARHTVGLLITAGGVQNNLLEYHALFDFCAPGLLGERSAFKSRYADVIERGQVWRPYQPCSRPKVAHCVSSVLCEKHNLRDQVPLQ